MDVEPCTGRMMERLEPSGWTRQAMEDIFVRFDGGFAKCQIFVRAVEDGSCFHGRNQMLVCCAESEGTATATWQKFEDLVVRVVSCCLH